MGGGRGGTTTSKQPKARSDNLQTDRNVDMYLFRHDVMGFSEFPVVGGEAVGGSLQFSDVGFQLFRVVPRHLHFVPLGFGALKGIYGSGNQASLELG